MSQEVDLSELLGRAPKPVELAAFEEQAVETIIQRTQSGDDRNGRPFTPYSPEYAEEKGSSDVDLTLMGDMLLGVKTRRTMNGVEIYLESDQVPKGYNHQVGDTLPKREWFGLTEDEARSIANRVKEDDAIPPIEFPPFFEQQQELNISEILANIGLFVDEN
jgi:hypothetical protein